MRKKILVIDDELDVVEMMSRKLERANFMPFVAFDGREGLDVSRNQDVDVILTDVVMPGMDGYQFLKRIKAEKKTSDIPVVVFTAHPDRELDFLKLGVDSFVAKPFGGQQMLEAIEQALSRKRRFSFGGKVIVQNYQASKIAAVFKTVIDPQSSLKMRIIEDDYDFITETLRQRPQIVFIDAFNGKMPADQKVDMLRSYPVLKDVAICVYAYCGSVVPAEQVKLKDLEKLKTRCLKAGATHFVDQLTPGALLDALMEYCRLEG